MLILKVVALEPIHGYGIVQRLQQISKEALQIRQGSLYPALYRLERHGYVRRAPSVQDHRQVLVRLTPAGATVLKKLSLAHHQELETAGPALAKALGRLIGDAA